MKLYVINAGHMYLACVPIRSYMLARSVRFVEDHSSACNPADRMSGCNLDVVGGLNLG